MGQLRRERVVAVCFVLLLIGFALVPRRPPLLRERGGKADNANTGLNWINHHGDTSFASDNVTVHIAMATCNNGITGVVNLLKSAILFKREEVKLYLHVVADDKSIGQLEEEVLQLTGALSEHNVDFNVYRVQFKGVNDTDRWMTLYKPCSSTRLFLHELLTDLTHIIYVDTDTMFLAPPEKLWGWFTKMNGSHLAALTFEHENTTIGWYNRFATYPFYGKTGLNSGVMLMNLEAIRRVNSWSQELSKILERYQDQLVWGDQDVLNVFFSLHPERVLTMPCTWNYRHDHCSPHAHCRDSETDGIDLLHGNQGMFLNQKGAEFNIMYTTLDRLHLTDILHRKVLTKRIFINRAISQLHMHAQSICGPLLIKSLSPFLSTQGTHH